MRLRRLEWTYKECPVYFLTLVAHERRPLFANKNVHRALIDFGENAAQHGVWVGRYVLMPDHIHCFVGVGPESPDVSSWVKSLKNLLSKHLRSNDVEPPHWQKGFFDHILRTRESYEQKWDYVLQNPVRAGLVQRPEEWEFQGEISRLL